MKRRAATNTQGAASSASNLYKRQTQNQARRTQHTTHPTRTHHPKQTFNGRSRMIRPRRNLYNAVGGRSGWGESSAWVASPPCVPAFTYRKILDCPKHQRATAWLTLGRLPDIHVRDPYSARLYTAACNQPGSRHHITNIPANKKAAMMLAVNAFPAKSRKSLSSSPAKQKLLISLF